MIEGNASVLKRETKREEIGAALLFFEISDFCRSWNATLCVTTHKDNPRIASSREIYASYDPLSGIDPQLQ